MSLLKWWWSSLLNVKLNRHGDRHKFALDGRGGRSPLLASGATRVIDMFRQWDADLSGEIDKPEFIKAVGRSAAFDAAPRSSSRASSTFDTDKGGTLNFKELNRQLRAGADRTSATSPSRTSLATSSRSSWPLAGRARLRWAPSEARASLTRCGGRKARRSTARSGSWPRRVGRQGAAAHPRKNAVRVIDLFRDQDEDQSGTITVTEFRRAATELGYEAPDADLKALFDEFDVDGGGDISYAELNKALRKAEIDDALKVARRRDRGGREERDEALD